MTRVRLLLLEFLAVSLALAADQFDLSACGAEKLCERVPSECQSAADCNVLFSSKPLDDDSVEFEVWGPSKLENGQNTNYLAVGFSKDDRMGDDGVTYCYNLADGTKGIGIGENQGYSFVASEQVPPELVELKEIRVEDDQFYCKFVQKVNRGSTEATKPDLSTRYHILLARGTAGDKLNLRRHDTKHGGKDFPIVTGAKNLLASAKPTQNETNTEGAASKENAIESVEGSALKLSVDTRRLLRRFHGALMIIAWLGLVSIAVFSARFLKENWPNTTVSGLPIWFHIHRNLNVTAVILIVLAAVLIFLSNELRWTGPRWSRFGNLGKLNAIEVHSLLGLITIVLTVLQPFIALMRCDKKHPRRPIFNVIHRTIGLVGLLLAVITLGIVMIHSDFEGMWQSPTLVMVIFIAFIVFVICVVVAQEVMLSQETRQNNRLSSVEMNSRNKVNGTTATDSYYYKDHPQFHSKRYQYFTSSLFLTLVGVSLSTALVLSYFVLISS